MSRSSRKWKSLLALLPAVLMVSACSTGVEVVTVDSLTGTTRPKKVKVKKDVEIVVWVASRVNGTDPKLHIDFGSDSPFPELVTCKGGRFCFALVPPNKQTSSDGDNIFEYTGTVTVNGQPRPLDPRVEVEH